MSRSDDDAESDQQELEREERRARRRRFLDRFVAAQRRERRWIALPDLALYCASTGAMTAAGAYRHLANLLRRGELSDARGRSRVLFLDPEPHQIPGQHRLSAAMIDGAIWAEAPIDQRSGGPAPLDAYAEADFAPRKVQENSETREVPAFVVSEFLECSYLLRDDARRVLERRGIAWPAHFDPERRSRKGLAASPPPRAATGTARPPQTDVTAWVKAYVDRAKSEGWQVSEAGMWRAMTAPTGLPNASRQQLRKAKALVLPRAPGRPRGSVGNLPK